MKLFIPYIGIMKLTKILLWLLVFTLPLIHGRIFQTLWIDFWLIVSGNFEFTKSMYFNSLCAVIYIVFFVEYIFIQKKQIWVSKSEKYVLILIFILLCSSTYFSISPYTSLIWDLDKWHTSLLYTNLLWLYVVVRQIELKQLRSIIYVFIISGVFTSILALKELYFPSFNYWELWDRALWSFGHPNYLSGFLLLLLPSLLLVRYIVLRCIVFTLFFVTIILCQSVFALLLAWWYLIYISRPWKKYVQKSYIFALMFIAALLVLWIITLYFPEKLHSFLSRFYLWESTLHILIEYPTFFLFGAWAETLPYYFSSYKAPELYIFENFGYTADRPHNFALSILYQFGVFWLALFMYLIYKLITLIKSYPSIEKNLSIWAIFLFLLYGVFHYFSISSYIVLVLAIALYFHPKQVGNYSVKVFFTIILFISFLWAFASIRLFAWEVYYASWETRKSLDMIFHPKYFLNFWETDKASQLEWIISERTIKTQMTLSQSKNESCENLISSYPSVENYFYCWDILESAWKDITAIKYYKLWLSKLPDLWNQDSEYQDNYFVKNTITGKKYWNLRSILEKVWK